MSQLPWHEAIAKCHQQGQAYVLVTLVGSMGSTPRDDGSKMVITADSCYDTIGGGHLELQVIKRAKALLAEGNTQQLLEAFPLSSKLGQCCGGATHALYDVLTTHQQTLALFGAGHVAKSLVPILSQLPMQIKWVDSRAEEFPNEIPGNVHQCHTDIPVDELATLPDGSWVVVMTHDHQLDFELVSEALKRKTMSYLGMIGSDTKARRFRTRLELRGFEAEEIERLQSPVGLQDVPGKRPVEVAVSIAAQLIQLLHQDDPKDKTERQKHAWRTTKAVTSS